MQAGASVLEGVQRDVALSVLMQRVPSFSTSAASSSTKVRQQQLCSLFILKRWPAGVCISQLAARPEPPTMRRTLQCRPRLEQL
jgi:hypothetical protein